MKRTFALLILLCNWHSLFSQSSVTITIQNANCISSTGTITINSVTTSATPNFSVSEGAVTIGTNVTLPFTFTNISVGSHTFIVTGSNSVAVTFTATIISNTTVPTVSASVSGTLTCSNPVVILTGTSNVGSATYTWSPQNVNTSTAVAIGVGNYTLAVTDPLNNCSNSTVIAVSQNTTAPNISTSTNGSITCTNTLVVVSGTSTTSGVTYSWGPSGNTTTSFSVIAPGIHTLIITNPTNGCKAVQTLTVYQITAFSASITSFANLKCNSINTGSVQIDALGGSGIFSVTILNNTVSVGTFSVLPINITTLSAINYSILLTDVLSGCTQLIFINLSQPPPLILSLTLLSLPEICEGEKVKITSNTSGGTPGYTYVWLPFGGTDSIIDILAGPSSYTLVAMDANSCIVTAVRNLTVHLKPQLQLLNNAMVVCGSSVCVSFTLGTALNPNYVYNWYFSDINNIATPIQVNNYNPNICFNQTGKYNVDLNIISLQGGCSTQSLFPTLIKLFPKVKADYSYDPPGGAYIYDDVSFTNQSSGSTFYSWYNENTFFSNNTNPTYMFYDPAQYLVSLIASNEGCSDTMSKHIYIGEATFKYFPNAFTPNHDGLNDVWRPLFYGDYTGEYELWIYDQWGKQMYWTIIIDKGWDGTHNGTPCEEGIYTWRVRLKTNTISKKRLTGTINLIR